MTASSLARVLAAAALLLGAGCTRPSLPPLVQAITPPSARLEAPGTGGELEAVMQLVVVTTATWDTTGGMLRRYERSASGDAWHAVGATVPVVVGRTGLAWDDRFRAESFRAETGTSHSPVKREGDGRSPAGIFALDTVFGFASRTEASWVRLPYDMLTPGSECVDDAASVHYNTIVDRATVPRVDWSSAERMRAIEQYRLGVTVGYNATPPHAGRGSCIFLHIWEKPGSSTAGCTAMAERDLRDLVLWMDRSRRPTLIQLPLAEYARLHEPWRIP